MPNPLLAALERLPLDHYVHLSRELRSDQRTGADDTVLTAGVMKTPPDGGWTDGHAVHKHDDRTVFGITATSVDDLERLLMDAIDRRWPAPPIGRPGVEHYSIRDSRIDD